MRRIFSPKNRALLAELVRTDFKIRYQNSVLGYAWSLLRPLFLFVILYIVFAYVFHLNKAIEHFPVYLLLGIVMWNFFVEMTMQSLGSIVGRGDLIRKIKIPRWIIILSTSLAALINLGLNLIVVAIFMIINHVTLQSSAVIFPLYLIEVYVLALGASFFLAAAFVKYRDVQYIWEVLLQAGFYATPILYLLTQIHSLAVQKILLLNPMGQIIQGSRYAVVTHQTITTHSIFQGGPYIYIPIIITLLMLLIGSVYFRSQSKYFAENI